MEKLGIIGYGIVGQAIEYAFKSNHEIHIYDKYKQSKSLKETTEKSDIIFICLPTPMKENGDIDLSIIDDTIEQVTKITDGTDKIITIKSTVTPGTTRSYSKKYPNTHFCFNPEFLTEANFLEDFVNTDRNVVGTDSDLVKRRIEAVYKNTFPRTPLILTDPTTAETAKYMANCKLATDVIIANEFYDLCQALKISYPKVKKIVVADKRIGGTHLSVTSERGFGGKCFPKDICAIINKFKELNIDVTVLQAIWGKNLKIRKHRDWEEIPGATSDGEKYKDKNENCNRPKRK